MTEPELALDGRSLSDQIYAHLRERILAGGFQPGDRLSEVSIAEEFEVSRAPVREALRLLASHGLAEQRARKGVYVPSFDAESFLHLSELREGLETMAVRLAALRASDEEIFRIDQLLVRTGKELDGGAYPSDLDFHAYISEASGNPELAEKIREINTRLHLVRLLSGMSDGRAARAYAEHAKIAKAIRSRDPDRAEAAMRNHLQRALGHARGVLELSRAQR